MVDPQLGGADGDLGFVLADPAGQRQRAPSRVWVRPAETEVSPVTAPMYRLPFLPLPMRWPD